MGNHNSEIEHPTYEISPPCYICGRQVTDGDTCDKMKNGYCAVALLQAGKDKVTFKVHDRGSITMERSITK